MGTQCLHVSDDVMTCEFIWYAKKMFIIKTAQFLQLINMNDTQVTTI